MIHAKPDSDAVVIHAWDGPDMMLAFNSRRALDDHFQRPGLKGKAANLVVDRNIEAFGRIINDKYERGEHRPYPRSGSTLRRVDVEAADIKSSGEKLSDSVLDLQWSWAGS